jgi:PAS domain S-box-containing protein
MSARPLTRSDAEPPHAAVATFEDVTNQRQQTKALEASRGLLARVLANSQDGIMVLDAVRDADGTVADFEWLLVNPRAEELLGRDVEDLVGCRLLDVIPESATSGLFDDYVAVVETGDPIEREVRYEQGDADAWFHVVAFRVEDGFAATFRDVTEQRRAAQAMAATNEKLEQRNRTLRDFAYIASHDLQEPLRKISSFSDLMMEDYGDAVDETGAYYLDRMQDAAQRMSQLISDLLVYSRVMTRARPFEPVDLGRLAEQVVSDLSLQIEEVDGSVHVGDLPTIEGDGTQLRQLLQNLVGNGLKFHRPDTPPEVTVSARTEREDEGPDTCTLVVEDNGIGFEQKYADRIFTPFKRLHGRDEFPGTGMGLAICRRIVERHNGRIDVVSTPGEGTRFAVVLPMQQDADPVYAGEAETGKGAGSPDPVSSRPSPATTD